MSKKQHKIFYFSFLFLAVFSQNQVVSAASLLETTTATGIANSIQGTPQLNPKELINDVKNTVNPEAQAVVASSPSDVNEKNRALAGDSLKQGPTGKEIFQNLQEAKTNEEVRSAFADEQVTPDESDSKRMKYTQPTVIFYKKDCEIPNLNCKRSHPVFTNLKNVMFDYANKRMNFQKESSK